MKMDAYIKANLKLVGGDYAIACIMSVVAGICLATFFLILLVLPAFGVAGYFLYRAYRKLDFDSLYGSSAYFFQGLPVTPKQVALGKIYVGGFGAMLFNVVTLIGAGFLGMAATSYTQLVEAAVQMLIDDGAVPEQVGLIASAGFIAASVGWFATSALILFGVALYQSMAGPRQSWLVKAAVVVLVWGMSLVSGNLADWIFEWFGLAYTVARPLLSLVVNGVVLVLAGWACIRLLERRYQTAT